MVAKNIIGNSHASNELTITTDEAGEFGDDKSTSQQDNKSTSQQVNNLCVYFTSVYICFKHNLTMIHLNVLWPDAFLSVFLNE